MDSEKLRLITLLQKELKSKFDYSDYRFLDKGWSSDYKFIANTNDKTRVIIRISQASELNSNQLRYSKIKFLPTVKSRYSIPIEFGLLNKDFSYTIFTWVEGVDLREQIENLSKEDQSALGTQAGFALRALHSLQSEEKEMDWYSHYKNRIEISISRYLSCDYQLSYGNKIIEFLKSNMELLRKRPITFQHGDYHIGNFVIDKLGRLGIIDFNRCSFGDPLEEFDRFMFTWGPSPPFAKSQILTYLQRNPTEQEFGILALYAAKNIIASIPWACQFGAIEINTMKSYADLVFHNYQEFDSFTPDWYSETEVAI